MRLFALSVLCVCFGSGCSYGWIYTDTVEPLCTNMQSTVAEGNESTLGLKEVTLPRIPGARTMWSSNAIGDAARAAGIETVYYCDRKRFSLLGGIWGQDSVVVYGK